MLFNSIDFALFLPIVFIIYWIIGGQRIRLQNLLLLGSSYVFYGWWDPRFLLLIIFSTALDFVVGQKLYKEENQIKRRVYLTISILSNLGLLGFFKYYNFFVENFIQAFSFFGFQINSNSLNIILPVGISFYTFQTLSYTIDIYRRSIEPARDFIGFSAFVSFFPQLVAGPIERARNLLPQFYTQRKFNHSRAVEGMRQILWGLFKKIVIADNCAEYANIIFNNSADYTGGTLLLGAIFFSFQIYGDFAGYSDIAIGTSKLFGIRLMKNFSFPYFSRDIAEFWRRWHISLSSWFRDYLYIPLGGSKKGLSKTIRNTFVVFILSGFWHGANWTFIVWGALNAIYFLPLLVTNKHKRHSVLTDQGRLIPSIREFVQIVSTFILVVIGWIFFRADSVQHAVLYIHSMLRGLLTKEGYTNLFNFVIWNMESSIFLLIVFFFCIEWLGRKGEFGIELIGLKWKPFLRFSFYFLLIISLFWFGGDEQQFIYFQF